MTTAAITTFAYDQIDQARVSLAQRAEFSSRRGGIPSLHTLRGISGAPSKYFDIAPGRHRAQVRRGLRRSNTVEIDVTAGGTARLEVRAGFWEIYCRVSDER